MLGAQALLSHPTNTKAELIVFTFAFQLAQGQVFMQTRNEIFISSCPKLLSEKSMGYLNKNEDP